MFFDAIKDFNVFNEIIFLDQEQLISVRVDSGQIRCCIYIHGEK